MNKICTIEDVEYEVEYHWDGRNRAATYSDPPEYAELELDAVWDEDGCDIVDAMDDALSKAIELYIIEDGED